MLLTVTVNVQGKMTGDMFELLVAQRILMGSTLDHLVFKDPDGRGPAVTSLDRMFPGALSNPPADMLTMVNTLPRDQC